MGKLLNIKKVAFNINTCATKTESPEHQPQHLHNLIWFVSLPPTPKFPNKDSLIHN